MARKTKMSFFGKIAEIGSKAVRYRLAGITNKDKTITACGDGYVGGGCYEDFFVYQNAIIPTATKSGECLENEEMEELMSLLTDDTFVECSYSEMLKYTDYEDDVGVTSNNDEMIEQGFLIVGNIKPVTFSMTGWEEPYGIPEKESERFDDLEDFMEFFHIDYTLKNGEIDLESIKK